MFQVVSDLKECLRERLSAFGGVIVVRDGAFRQCNG